MSKETLSQAKKIIAEALQISISEIQDDSSIDTYGKLDSLSFERVILEVEKLLGHRIKAVDLLKMATVQDLADFIEADKAS